MSLLDVHERFLADTVRRLAGDERIAAVVLTGSSGRGEADDWSDLDINVIAVDLEAHLLVLAPLVAPRACEATRRRLDLVRETLSI